VKRIFIVVLLLIASASSSHAQSSGRDWNQRHDPFVGAIGLNFGASSGSGLAIRWPALPQTMFTATGAIWGKSGELQWDFGLEAHYILRQASRTRLFVGPSVAHYDFDDSIWNLGAGVGLEVLLWPRWALKFDLSFTWLSEEDAVYPLPQAGLLYYF
jgi:hypothetical protein